MTFVPRFPNAPVNYEHQNESQFRSQVLQALTASSSAVVLDGSLDDFFGGVLGDTLVHDGTQFVGSKRFTEDMEFSKQLIFYESTGGTQESTFDLIGGGGFSGNSGDLVTSGGINLGFTDISEASAQVGTFPSSTFDYIGTTVATVVNVGGTEGYTIQQNSSSASWSYWPKNWYRTVPNGEGELLARVYMDRTGSGSRQRFGVGFAAVTFTSPGSGTYQAGGPGVVGFSFNNALRVTGIVHDASQATNVTSTYLVPAFSAGWGWVRMRVADTSGGKMQYQIEVIPPGSASAKDSPPAFGGTWNIDQESTIAITRAAFDHTPGYYRHTSGPNQTGTRHLSYLSFSSDSTFAQGAPIGQGDPAYLQLRNLNNNLTKFWQTPLASVLGAGNRETAFGLIRGNRTNDTGFELFNDEASGTGSQGIRLYKAGTGSYEPFYFRWGATTGLTILSPDDVGGPYWTFHDPLNFEGSVLLDDDVRLELGTGQDYWFEYDSTATALQLWSTDVDGLGADGRLFEVVDGTDDIEFFGVVTGTGGFYTTAGGTLQGTWTDLGTVTTMDLNGGTIDGTTIGGASAAAGTFTTLTANTSLTIAGTTTVSSVLDEDTMVSDSATALATQQSIKAYVDSQVTAQDLDFAGDSGTGAVDLDSQVFTIAGTANEVETSASGQTLTIGLPSNVTITTALSVDTINEKTLAAGVTIDSVLLKDDVVNATDIEVATISANDGVQSAVIANTTGVMTIASSVLTTTDINGGTVDGAVIGGASAAAGTFTTLTANTNLTIAGTTTISSILDEDNMVSDSATALATQQSIKAYVDSQVTAAQDLDFAGDSGTGAVDLDTQVFTIAGTAGEIETSASGQAITVGLPTNVTIAGNLTVDTDTLFVDATNNRVGIGTPGPAVLLHVENNASELLRVKSTGSYAGVYIDTASATGGGFVALRQNGTTCALVGVTGAYKGNTDANFGLFAETGKQIEFATDGDAPAKMVIDTSGNVGIGTASPGTPLHISRTAGSSTFTRFTREDLTNESWDQRIDAGGTLEIRSVTDAGTTVLNAFQMEHATGDLTLKGWIRSEDGTAGAPTYSFSSDPDTGMWRATTNELAFSTAGAVRMRIDANGNVGIGASPSSRLEVFDTVNGLAYLTFQNSSTGTSAVARLRVGNNGSPNAFTIDVAGSNHATKPNQVEIFNQFNAPLTFGSNGTERMRIAANGDVSITGALSKGSGSFRIEHPLPAKADTHNLVHSFIEGPRADLIYRGIVNLADGFAEVDLDEAATMTTGTWELLCRDAQVFVQNESGWSLVRGSVSGSTLTINAQDNTSTDTVSWIVVAERKDVHMMDTNWTDDNGRVIVEPLKEIKA